MTTPQWLVERIHLEALPPDELSRARAALLAEPGGAERLAALAADDAAALGRLTPARVAKEVRARHRPAPRAAIFAVPAVVAAALAVAVVAPRVAGHEVAERLKGSAPELLAHRQRGGTVERLREGAVVAAGDVVQLSYVAAGQRFEVVLSVDALGAVTLHWPEQEGPAPELLGSGAHPLPRAFALDDAPGFERFFLVTGDRPFDADVALRAARALRDAERGRLDLPAGLSQQSLLLRKEAR
ncbi:MAG: hypothetical protein K1X89_27235 [Myxococcaceae bacterium]|nr:hypothetical protein [Myxococcaceae bacterium]